MRYGRFAQQIRAGERLCEAISGFARQRGQARALIARVRQRPRERRGDPVPPRALARSAKRIRFVSEISAETARGSRAGHENYFEKASHDRIGSFGASFVHTEFCFSLFVNSDLSGWFSASYQYPHACPARALRSRRLEERAPKKV